MDVYCQSPEILKRIDYNRLKMDYKVYIFRNIIIDYNRLFFCKIFSHFFSGFFRIGWFGFVLSGLQLVTELTETVICT